jgi:Ni/Co efflux regulator RcnB
VLLELLVLALLATALVAPLAARAIDVRRRRIGQARARARRRAERRELRDPGRERRAEQRARELLRSCVNDEEWSMYRDLGFIRVHGRLAVAGPDGLAPQRRRREPRFERDANADRPRAGRGSNADRRGKTDGDEQPPYAYLIYPHKPIVAYVPATGRLLSEYCVEFPDLVGAISDTRLPDSDDVLAKWMALTGDERRLIADSNMHLPGRQVDPGRVRRDLWRLAEWDRLRRGSTANR